MNSYSFEEIYIGLDESFIVKINSRLLEMFIDISGDSNPLHVDSVYAQSKGYSGKVVHGLLTSSFYSKLVGLYLPGKNCLLHSVDIKFTKSVHIDDELTVYGRICYVNTAYRQIEIDAFIENQHNSRVSKAKIKVGFLDE